MATNVHRVLTCSGDCVQHLYREQRVEVVGGVMAEPVRARRLTIRRGSGCSRSCAVEHGDGPDATVDDHHGVRVRHPGARDRRGGRGMKDTVPHVIHGSTSGVWRRCTLVAAGCPGDHRQGHPGHRHGGRGPGGRSWASCSPGGAGASSRAISRRSSAGADWRAAATADPAGTRHLLPADPDLESID